MAKVVVGRVSDTAGCYETTRIAFCGHKPAASGDAAYNASKGADIGVTVCVPVYTLERLQVVRMPLEECWRFFSDPRNLAKITPPELRFVVQSEDLPTEIHPGLMIRYSVSPLWRIPMTWVSEITQVRRWEYFVDEQRAGPYRSWHHEHFFRALDDTQTEMRDQVRYAPPFGPIGALMNALFIRRQLKRIFDFREEQLNALRMSS